VGPILQIAKTVNGQAAGISHALIGQSLDVSGEIPASGNVDSVSSN